jgi:hypothetical protein
MPFFFRGVSQQPGFPFPVKMLGMMYVMSFDLVMAIGSRPYKVRVGSGGDGAGDDYG